MWKRLQNEIRQGGTDDGGQHGKGNRPGKTRPADSVLSPPAEVGPPERLSDPHGGGDDEERPGEPDDPRQEMLARPFAADGSKHEEQHEYDNAAG
jgi:hypothetical protein